MEQEDKTKEELLEELKLLQKRLAEFEILDSEHKKAEQQLKDRYNFLSNVVDSFGYPFYVLDINDYIVKMGSATTMKKFGAITEKITCYALTHKLDKPCSLNGEVCPLEVVRKTKAPFTVEHIHFEQNGSAKNMEVHGFPIFDEKGNVVQMIEYSLDITERKQMEAEAQKRLLELEIFYKASVGREERIIELKKEIKQLKEGSGK